MYDLYEEVLFAKTGATARHVENTTLSVRRKNVMKIIVIFQEFIVHDCPKSGKKIIT